MIQKFNQGEVWLANLNPNKGAEPGKIRPVIIIQTQALLDINHPSTLIIPLTTQLVDNATPLRLRLKARDKLEKDSDLLIDQIRAIDNSRLLQGPLMQCGQNFLRKVGNAVSNLIDV